MATINIGDIVQLRTGGPLMTVKETASAHLSDPDDAEKTHVICQWFDDRQVIKMGRFHKHSLQVRN